MWKINSSRNILPYVAAIICYYVRMFAALHDDYFLLDDGKIILCGPKQTKNISSHYKREVNGYNCMFCAKWAAAESF